MPNGIDLLFPMIDRIKIDEKNKLLSKTSQLKNKDVLYEFISCTI